MKGMYNMVHEFIQAQPNPKEPTGTIITVSSGRAGLTTVGGSAYNISKIAEEKLTEHLHEGKFHCSSSAVVSLTVPEYPTLRVFSTMPGIVKTEMAESSPFWIPFAKDHVDLVGMLALYLVQARADFLRGGMVGVNWDVEEMEQHKEEIEEKKLLHTAWLPILPIGGGKGVGA